MNRRKNATAFALLFMTIVAGCGGPSESAEASAQSSNEALSAGGDPLFKLLLQDSTRLDHFYTTNWNEVMSAQAAGYLDYGPVGRCFSTQIAGTVPLFRLYSQVAVDHFYTTSAAERSAAVAQGYAFEGVACFVFPSNAAGTCPFYRYYFYSNSPVGDQDHFYTESAREGALAVQSGYRYEGVAAFLSPYGDSCPQ